LIADEYLVESLDEVVVLETAAGTAGEATAVAEAGRNVDGRGAGLVASAADDGRRSAAAAARAAGGAARRAGEHVVGVHGAEDQAASGRPADAAEPTRDLAANRRRRRRRRRRAAAVRLNTHVRTTAVLAREKSTRKQQNEQENKSVVDSRLCPRLPPPMPNSDELDQTVVDWKSNWYRRWRTSSRYNVVLDSRPRY